MPLSQAQKNYSLFLAASAKKLSDVKLYLSQGAEVVDIEKNDDCSVIKAVPHTYYVRGDSYSLPLQSALHYALAARDIEMIALLAQSALKTNAITAGLIHFANARDIESSSAKYLTALTNPDHALALFKIEQEKNAVKATQQASQRRAEAAALAEKNAQKNREEHVFDHLKLDALTFKNDQNDAAVASLNEAIARTYVEAKKMNDAAGFFTYRMKDKARHIVKQLEHLHQHYQNIEPKPQVAQYYNDASSGNTLTEIVQNKRIPNPFVMYAKSWSHLEKVTPDLKPIAESQSYRR
jgi:hypothetical protein